MLGFFEDNTIDQVYSYEVLQKFAFGLIGIFIPVYIAVETSSLPLVFLYLLGYTVVMGVAAFPVSYAVARMGFKHGMMLSYLFSLPALFVLYSWTLSYGVVALVALLIGLGKSFHWIPLHSEFAVNSDESNRGKASGRILGLPRISRAVAPFIGGVILASLGFQVLALVSILFALLSGVPLLASGDHRDPLDYSLREYFSLKHLKFAALFTLRGFGIAAGVYLFPLYVFYVVGGSVNVGGVSSLASFGAVVFTLFIGRVSDRVERSHLMVIGLIASAVLFALRSYVSTAIEAFLLSFVAGLMFMVYYVPLYSHLADTAEDEDVLEFYAFRETTLSVGRITVFGLTLLVALESSIVPALKLSFYVTGLATLLILLLLPRMEV